MKRHAAAVAVVSLLVASSARADATADRARAEALFEQGQTLRGNGQTAEACAAFDESRKLDEGIGVTLYLGDCYQALGDAAHAIGAFRRAEALALARHDARAEIARRRADALASHPAPDEVAATAPPPAEATPVSLRAPAEAQADSPLGSPPPADDAARAHATRRWIGLGAVAAGAVGLGLGATFGAMAITKLSQSNDGPCDASNRCSPTGLALRSESSHAATASTIGFVAGAAAVGAGLAVYFTTPRDGEGVTLAPSASASGAGAVLAGRF